MESQKRTFSLTNLSVDNGTSVFLLAIMILIFGLFAYDQVPKEQFPEVEFPQVYINTPYFGNSAADIENLITRPLEKELQSVDGVKIIRSTSIQDFSVITVEFNSDEDFDDAVRRTKDAVDQAKPELPSDLDTEPTVLEINLSQLPIVTVNMSGDFPPEELRRYAELMEDELENVDGVSAVNLKGIQEREIEIAVDVRKMESLEISFQDVENAVSAENLTLSGGEIKNNGMRRAIRVVGEFEDAEELANTIVKNEKQRLVYLRDIADVTFGYEEPKSIARANALPVISLDVIKKSGENLLTTSDGVQATVKEVAKSLPEDLEITFFNDQSYNTRDQVDNLENSIISGVILVVLVLLFFLGLRNALFVGIAIPLSMLMGILWIYLSGVTLNIVVLFALILALGLLVDNGIVIVENIFRYMQNGEDAENAAKYGAGEVAWPIIASTATTLAAFSPLAVWPGIVGEFMKYFPITLILVLVSSLIVALVINPVLASRFMVVDRRAETQRGRKRKVQRTLISAAAMMILGVLGLLAGAQWLFNLMVIFTIVTLLYFFLMRPAALVFQDRFLPWLENQYRGTIERSLRWGGLVMAGTLGLMVLSLVLTAIKPPAVEFFPSADPLYINAFVELPLGSDIEATNEATKVLESKIIAELEPYQHIVESVLTQIGENTSDPNAPPEPGFTPNKARITVSFVPFRERGGISTTQVMDEIRQTVKGVPGVRVTVDKNADGPATGKPINLEIAGEDIDKLIPLGDEVISYINAQGIPGIEELAADVKLGVPELLVKIDREAARRFGLSTFQIASALRTSVYGKEISKYKLGEEEYPIFLRLKEEDRNRVASLLDQRITFRDPATGRISQVPISTVASVEYTSTYSSIKRKDLDRVITISSNVLDGYVGNDIIPQIDAAMQNYDLPQGFTYEFTGEQQQQQEDVGFLLGAFVFALFLIFIIIVAQFNSISSPFIILSSVILSTIGVLLGYFFFGGTFSVVFTGVGIISLAGVVVNNAIVLIDYTTLLMKEKLRERGLKKISELELSEIRDCIVEGGATRLRPVLLTAITTVLGLIPLAIGFNFDFFSFVASWDGRYFLGGDNTAIWGPMAWTVIYGLVFATFLTLVVVPVMLWLVYRTRRATKRLIRRVNRPVEDEPERLLSDETDDDGSDYLVTTT
ncbi:efflux RND transporter permease subunit [Neolewinella lacunae]|uniref:Efflux RND transporter permease subunit n=1 Tax=Neolewinella lacunae TaxID=1517758 RepID=A0A923PNN1_9BACT|nr:efflux RND transporter permease subunit [Neolewinella lacunae]MBC6993832.1 efflux RND transporter permease subunit [Neolewinella lacunae]MDN3635277.1 efflux RND transporter permease subunit [Neolewinella lacunae]